MGRCLACEGATITLDFCSQICEDQYRKYGIDEPKKDSVNHPRHYTTGKIEVIAFIEDKELNYHRGNAVKYIARAGKKDPKKEVEDLQKAAWYINREIKRLEEQK